MSEAVQPGSQPQTAIHHSYRDCLEARKAWIGLGGISRDEADRDSVHAWLHEATMAWFETLLPYLAERTGEVRQYWESAPLWPVAPSYEEALCCEECESLWEMDGPFELHDVCPDCGAIITKTQVIARNERGEVLYQWQQGLKHLTAVSDQADTVVKTSEGSLFAENEIVEEPRRLNPDVLIRIGRYLDQAAEEMELLSDTGNELPVGQL